jgi:hypothetical protein
MTRQEILGTAKEFLSLLEGRVPMEERERRLRWLLDRLALAYHFADAPFDSRDVPAPPRADDAALRPRIGQLFPGLGLYNAVLDVAEKVGESEPGIGDAVDDLTDIARDLQEVVTRWEMSEEDALWHFRFGFESHWGRHLRSLQLYLHERAF